jgi:hypothetical protein
MTVRKFLDISTTHAPNEAALDDVLERFGKGRYDDVGGWVYVRDPNQRGYWTQSYPDWLSVICAKAHELGCDYILLNRDADQRADLPTWEW